MGLEALGLCYLQDKAMNTGSEERPFYMTEVVHATLTAHMRPEGAKSHAEVEKERRAQRRREVYLSAIKKFHRG